MYYMKAIIVGVTGAFFMFLITSPMIVWDTAPFNLPPAAAFLAWLDLYSERLTWVVHFIYGMFWSVVFLLLFGKQGTLWQGLGLGFGLWLLLMLVFSPMIGWGVFGFGEAHLLDRNNPLWLAQGNGYWILTLLTHMVYGAIVGWLNPLWDQADTL